MRQIIFVILLVLLQSCGNSSSGPNGGQDPYYSRPLPVTQEEQVTLTRKKQMTLRYDCHGHVISHQLENVGDLAKKMTIKYSGRKDAWSYDVYNRTSRSGKKGFFADHGRFVIDLSPTVFNMKVNRGLNEIEYVFYKCPKISQNPQGNKICAEKPVLEKEGIFRLEVLYASEVIPGERHIYKTTQQCEQVVY